MENNTEKIKRWCPNPSCGVGLRIKVGLKQVTCPKCHHTYAIEDFKTEPGTVIQDKTYRDLGELRHRATGKVFALVVGRNIIGRETRESNATIQIPCGESKKLSREHLVVEVMRRGDGYCYYVSLFKDKVNPTRINGTLLEYGDIVELEPGYLLELADQQLSFEIPDRDQTSIN